MAGVGIFVLTIFCLVQSTVAIKCLYNFSYSDVQYSGPVITSAMSSHLDLGVRTCQPGLDYCANFEQTAISEFLKLDASIKDRDFSNLFKDFNNKIAGKACISKSDATYLGSAYLDDCTHAPSCYCEKDKCTGDSATGISFAWALIAPILAFATRSY